MQNYIQLFGLTLPINRSFTIPIAGGIEIYWYGVLIALGFALAVLYACKRSKEFGLNSDQIIDVLLLALPLAIIGARLYYCVFTLDQFTNIQDIINIRDGGLAFYGGVIGAVIGGAIMCKIRKINLISLLDLAAPGFLIGQAIGRWGNFVNQEAYGTATGSDWFGMTGNLIYQRSGSMDLVHPCFLYESLWCAAGLVVLHLLSKRRKFRGQIAATYLIWYGAGRTVIEGLRTDSLMLGPIRFSQILSACMVVAGILIYVFVLKHQRDEKNTPEYRPVFLDAETGEPVVDVLEESLIVMEHTQEDSADAQETEKDQKKTSDTLSEAKKEISAPPEARKEPAIPEGTTGPKNFRNKAQEKTSDGENH